ncbi:hypothetical protein HDA39_004614 [Kribbella italica]|uniref:Uncharacterized protein n=1 Tax=Kribbella italica TaxID=1540520 RepID=A0A7W9J9Z4_9ACTN|nr:hypothetical protein [Kribbella italica]
MGQRERQGRKGGEGGGMGEKVEGVGGWYLVGFGG